MANANLINYFSSLSFAKASLEEYIDMVDHYLGQSDYLGDGTLEQAVFGEQAENVETGSENVCDFDILEFMRSPQALAAYHEWCKENAQERVSALEEAMESGDDEEEED